MLADNSSAAAFSIALSIGSLKGIVVESVYVTAGNTLVRASSVRAELGTVSILIFNAWVASSQRAK